MTEQVKIYGDALAVYKERLYILDPSSKRWRLFNEGLSTEE